MTEYRASRAERANAQRTSNGGANWAVPTVPVNNGPSATGNCSPADSASDDEQAGDEEDDPERSVTEALDEEHKCEDGGNCATPPDTDFSAEDLVTLVMDFTVTSGMPWTIVEKLMTFVYCLNSSADAPASALMQNRILYNGYFGCSYCLHPGKSVEGTVKYPVGITSVPDRTKEEVESDMVEAFRTGVNVRGIKGPSPLINLPGFDIVWSFSPDYMHLCCLV
ncbi:hypothetical protein HPB47_026298 [Ixodes persulcatus]|uniref:Uncharacterized protein n=1 Tax=Ixodes persulcatus TaxID=34615 RepID=A0AC60PZF8_IXOPE|nr:hypothetical protein HPB47_026298 [Ixodes persulcatus]